MNDIAKKATADRFLSALKKEGLSKKEAGDIIGIYPPDVTKLLNEKYWPALSSVIWDKVLAWANSGYSLREYPRHKRETSQVIQSSDEVATEIKKDPEKHGRMLPDEKEQEHNVNPIKASEVAKNEMDTLHKNLSNYKPDIIPDANDNVIKIKEKPLPHSIQMRPTEEELNGVSSDNINSTGGGIHDLRQAINLLGERIKTNEDQLKIISANTNQKVSSNLSDLDGMEKEDIELSNLIKIVISLKMKATKYRELANDFDKVANNLLK